MRISSENHHTPRIAVSFGSIRNGVIRRFFDTRLPKKRIRNLSCTQNTIRNTVQSFLSKQYTDNCQDENFTHAHNIWCLIESTRKCVAYEHTKWWTNCSFVFLICFARACVCVCVVLKATNSGSAKFLLSSGKLIFACSSISFLDVW